VELVTLDCFVASLLAMTRAVSLLAMTGAASLLAMTRVASLLATTVPSSKEIC